MYFMIKGLFAVFLSFLVLSMTFGFAAAQANDTNVTAPDSNDSTNMPPAPNTDGNDSIEKEQRNPGQCVRLAAETKNTCFAEVKKIKDDCLALAKTGNMTKDQKKECRSNYKNAKDQCKITFKDSRTVCKQIKLELKQKAREAREKLKEERKQVNEARKELRQAKNDSREALKDLRDAREDMREERRNASGRN